MAIEIGMSIESSEKPRVESGGDAYETTNHDEHHTDADRNPEDLEKLDAEVICRPGPDR